MAKIKDTSDSLSEIKNAIEELKQKRKELIKRRDEQGSMPNPNAVGDMVKITDGPFLNFMGTIVELPSRGNSHHAHKLIIHIPGTPIPAYMDEWQFATLDVTEHINWVSSEICQLMDRIDSAKQV